MNVANREVSAVLVNYNGLSFAGACIKSLHGLKGIREIILVDNDSKDGSPELLANEFPEIVVRRLGTNAGFARACNEGAAVASGKYILLLNYDAEMEGGLDGALQYLEAQPRVGILGGRLVYPTGAFQPSVGLPHTPLRLLCSWLGLGGLSSISDLFTREILDESFYGEAHRPVCWVSGALMLVRSEVWAEIAGMDPGFFLYLEDMDLCHRASRAGWEVAYSPELKAVHMQRGGANCVSARALLSTIDSMQYYLRKSKSWWVTRLTMLGIGLIFTARALVLAARFWRGVIALAEGRVFLKGAMRAGLIGLGKTYAWGPPV